VPDLRVVENKPVRHRGLLAKVHWRALFTKVATSQAQNRSEEAWLRAAVTELEPLAGVDIGVGAQVTYKKLEDLKGLVEAEISDHAVRGIRVGLKQAILGNQILPRAPILEREDLLNAASGFGAKFRKLVEQDSKLEEAKAVEDDEPLDLSDAKEGA
jgi:hypothetical protein